jgi:hypothetical protein
MALVAAAVLVPATAAWAPHVPQFNVTPSQMRPGDQVTVAGTRGFGFTNPVEIRLNSVDGPLVGSFQPNKESYAAWGPGTITIPADLQPGTHYLYATQMLADVEKHIRGVPARATIEVLGEGGAPIVGADSTKPGQQGAPRLARRTGPSPLQLALVTVGVAGLGIFVVGMGVLARQRGSATERVR